MLARVLRRLPTDVLLLVTVLFWSFDFTVCSFRLSPFETPRKRLVLAVFTPLNGIRQIP
jgi:hypothetical protein